MLNHRAIIFTEKTTQPHKIHILDSKLWFLFQVSNFIKLIQKSLHLNFSWAWFVFKTNKQTYETNLNTKNTSLRCAFYHGHSYIMDTLLSWTLFYHGHSFIMDTLVIQPDPSLVLSYNLNELFICRFIWVDRHTREWRHRKWRVHLIWQDAGWLGGGAVHLFAHFQVRYGLHKAGLGLLKDPFHF